MALGFLKVVGAIGRGVKTFVAKRKEKKEAKIEKRVQSAIAKSEKQKAGLASLFGTDQVATGGSNSAIKGAASALISGSGGFAGFAADSAADGEVSTAKGLPFDWKNPIVLVIGVVGLMFL